MNTNDTNKMAAHSMIDHIFKDLLPAKGMSERPEQIRLSHRMLDTMLDGGIALCDAGTGIGKTFAYLAAASSRVRSSIWLLVTPGMQIRCDQPWCVGSGHRAVIAGGSGRSITVKVWGLRHVGQPIDCSRWWA